MKENHPVPARPIVIFDFDGTVTVGDGPVLAYASTVGRLAGLEPSFVEELAARLGDGGAGEILDGYDLVRLVAEEHGIDAELLGVAYLESRSLLGGDDARVLAPAGLARFLDGLDARRVLVTNAPPVRIAETLAALGLRFDRIVTDAGKPDGLERLLEELEGVDAPGGPAAPDRGIRILSIGDVWRNDLAPAHARGHATALVGRFADPTATPTFRAETLEELYPAITSWLAQAASATEAVGATGPAPQHSSTPPGHPASASPLEPASAHGSDT